MATTAAPTPEELRRQQEFTDNVETMEDTYRSIAVLLKDILGKQKDLEGSTKKIAEEYSKDLVKTYRQLAKDSLEVLDNEERLLTGSIKSKDIQKQISDITSKQGFISSRINQLKKQSVAFDASDLRIQQDSEDTLAKQLVTLKEQLVTSEKIEKAAGLTGKIFADIANLPLISKLVSAEKVTEAIYQNAAKSKSAWSAFGAGLLSTFTQMGKKLTDPLVLFTAQIALLKKFYDLYGGVNKRIVEQGKQLNISKEQSQALYESAYQYAAEQRNAFVTEARILEGRYKLNEALGTSIAFTNKEAITAEKLSHYYGLSEEQNAHLAVLGREIGQTNDDILNTVIKTTVNQKAQFGGTISQQKILQKVSSVSGEILTKFKGNVSELTKAVQQADKLGLTLEQVDKIGESLLNFEQSIEAELKAELLTGKAINLEKARAAALSGDTVKLTNEIAQQVGNIHKFEKLNTIQRQAYAEAFGMTASEMGDMLRKREFEAKLGADAQKSAEEQLKIAKERGITIEESVRKDLEAKSLAELQKYTFEKIKSVLERIASGPMATIFKYLEKGLKFVESIFGTFSKMTGGGLGNALGAAILGAPLLLATTRMMAGGIKGLFFQRGTDMNPMVTRMQGAIGGLGSRTGFTPGLGFTGGALPGGLRQNSAGQYIGANGRFVSNASVTAAQQAQGAMGMRNMGIGMGLGIGGIALSGIASNMTPGAGADTVGVLGQTATYAGMGMMFGPIGAGIGALVGLTAGLFQLQSKADERAKAEETAKKDADKKTNDLLESLAVRPVTVQVGPEKMNNALNQYGKSVLE
jgi:hypothetical protein